jgi:hypothetical protein
MDNIRPKKRTVHEEEVIVEYVLIVLSLLFFSLTVKIIV